MNIYQSNSYRKDFSWLHFYNDTRVQESQQVLDQYSCIPVCVTFLIYRSPGIKALFHARSCSRLIEIKNKFASNKLHRTNQGSDFLGDSFSNRDNVRAPVQFRTEKKSQYLKMRCFFKNRRINFHVNSTRVIRLGKQNKISFFNIEINKSLTALVYSVS